MFDSIHVIGTGRVGSAIVARLDERGVAVSADDPELIILCVPDAAIAEVARSLEPGPWIAHVSGATPLAALDPHERRFSVHPLQTFTRARGAEQLDGAWAAVTGETPDALARGTWLATELGLLPFELADSARTLYHAGAAIASNYLVTLYRAAASLFDEAGAPPGGARAADAADDRERVRADRADLAGRLDDGRRAPRRAAVAPPRARGDVPRPRGGDRTVITVRTKVDLRAALAGRGGAAVGLVPTMGALHEGHVALFRAAREESDLVVASIFVNPSQFAEQRDLDSYPRDLARDAGLPRRRRRRRLRRRRSGRCTRRGSRRGSSPAGPRRA